MNKILQKRDIFFEYANYKTQSFKLVHILSCSVYIIKKENLNTLYIFHSHLSFWFKLKFNQSSFKSTLHQSYLNIIQQLFINCIIMSDEDIPVRSLYSFIARYILEKDGYSGKYNAEMFKIKFVSTQMINFKFCSEYYILDLQKN